MELVMRITKRQLRQIIKEEKAKLHEQPQQLSFNDTAVEETDSLLDLLDTFTNRYRKLTFEFPDSVNDDTINDIEGLILDAADKLRDIKYQMQARGIK
jgi:hypothetical protein